MKYSYIIRMMKGRFDRSTLGNLFANVYNNKNMNKSASRSWLVLFHVQAIFSCKNYSFCWL